MMCWKEGEYIYMYVPSIIIVSLVCAQLLNPVTEDYTHLHTSVSNLNQGKYSYGLKGVCTVTFLCFSQSCTAGEPAIEMRN